MTIMLYFLFVLLCLSGTVQLVAGNLLKITFPSAESEFPPNCTFSNGAEGVCKSDCQEEELNGADYKICYFLEGEIYTCCPLEQQKKTEEPVTEQQKPQVESTDVRLAEQSCIKLKQQREPMTMQKLPFMFLIGWTHAYLPHKYHYKCLGMLISPDYILTAAHCTYFNGGQPNAVLPANTSDESQVIEISEVLTHDDYDGEEVYNDIALLKLAHPIDADFACLWPNTLELPKSLHSIGFKQVREGNDFSNKLVEANFTIVPHELCATSYKVDDFLPNGIVEQQLCAQHVQQQQHAPNATQCQGDGGGPLLTYATLEGQQRAQVIGIASFGKGGCYESPPTVYTRVSAYHDWLVAHIWPKDSNTTTST